MRTSVSKIVKWRWERDGILIGTIGTLSEELTKVPSYGPPGGYYLHSGPSLKSLPERFLLNIMGEHKRSRI